MALVEEKIQLIAKEVQEANASQWTVTKIVKALTEMNTASEKKLREKALALLRELDTEAAAIYERFSTMKVYTSDEKVMGFNRGNIITSLLKETSISRAAAEKITLEVENQVKDAKIPFLTPSHIRELVNAKLISYGFWEVRNEYARVGEPAYEVKKKLEKQPYFGESVREYNTLLALPKIAKEMHFDGAIHIEDIEGFSHRPYAHSIIAEKKESMQKTIHSALKQVSHASKYFSIQPSIYGLTFACAPFAKTKKDLDLAAQTIVSASEILQEKPLISIELFVPKVLEELGKDRLAAAQIANKLLDEKVVVNVDSKYCLKLITEKNREFMVLNNSDTEYFPFTQKIFSETRGIALFVNINLEKMAQAGNEDAFFEKLSETAQVITNLRKEKNTLLAKKKYLEVFEPQEMKTAIGITSIYKACEKLSEQKPADFAQKTVKELSKLFEEDLLFGLAGEKARERFSEIEGKEVFSQETLPFDECLNNKKLCFTGKAGTKKELNELLDKKVKQIQYMGFG